jgi:gamma-glutamyl-gamma-aminobutyrate hydrolase PuuD
MSAPVIGLSTYAEPAQWAAWQAPAALLPLSYIGQITEAGGVPVLLPPVPGIARALGRLDGLILTGGGDIDPAGYGAEPDPRTSRVHPERDQAELELLAAALADGLPVLGICRGMQLINVARGGTLYQDLAAGAGHRPAPGTFGSHPVRLAPGSQLTSILQPDGAGTELTLNVPTAHHQGIARLGDGLVPAAWAEDGLIEAVELAPGPGQHSFMLAVQWHPEASQDRRLVSALVAAAADGPGRGAMAGAGRAPAGRATDRHLSQRRSIYTHQRDHHPRRRGARPRQEVWADHGGGWPVAVRRPGPRHGGAGPERRREDQHGGDMRGLPPP